MTTLEDWPTGVTPAYRWRRGKTKPNIGAGVGLLERAIGRGKSRGQVILFHDPR